MGIRGERKRKAAKQARKQRQRQRVQRWSKTKKWTVAATSALVAVVGLIASGVGIHGYASPRVLVGTSELLDPTKPFSAPFTITNNGNLSIRRVTIRCQVLDAGDDFDTHVVMPRGSPGMYVTDLLVPEIRPAETSTIGCPFPFYFEHPMTHADVIIYVKYTPDWLPSYRETSSRFAITRDTQGHMKWMPRTVSEE
jgi:hypothetical protein